MATGYGKNQLWMVKDPSTAFTDPESGFEISGSEKKVLPVVITKRIKDWCAAGGLVPVPPRDPLEDEAQKKRLEKFESWLEKTVELGEDYSGMLKTIYRDYRQSIKTDHLDQAEFLKALEQKGCARRLIQKKSVVFGLRLK